MGDVTKSTESVKSITEPSSFPANDQSDINFHQKFMGSKPKCSPYKHRQIRTNKKKEKEKKEITFENLVQQAKDNYNIREQIKSKIFVQP